MGMGWEDHSVIYGGGYFWNGCVGLKIAICVLEYESILMGEIIPVSNVTRSKEKWRDEPNDRFGNPDNRGHPCAMAFWTTTPHLNLEAGFETTFSFNAWDLTLE
jgi:hypothetical protein